MVQAEMEAKSEPQPVEPEDERGPLGLLKRLTTGLSRKEEHEAPAEPRLRPIDNSAAKGQAEPRRPLSQDASLYAPAKGQLDDHGRTQNQGATQGDDQLEIPAFLRRQAN